MAKKILLVDDDVDYLLQEKLQLEAAGYQTLTAETMKEATELLDGADFDIAVIDLMMEEVDAGFTLCYRIKKKKPDVPVILVTGVTSESGYDFDAATGEERSWVKADALLDKPVRFEQLVGEIERLLAG